MCAAAIPSCPPGVCSLPDLFFSRKEKGCGQGRRTYPSSTDSPSFCSLLTVWAQQPSEGQTRVVSLREGGEHLLSCVWLLCLDFCILLGLVCRVAHPFHLEYLGMSHGRITLNSGAKCTLSQTSAPPGPPPVVFSFFDSAWVSVHSVHIYTLKSLSSLCIQARPAGDINTPHGILCLFPTSPCLIGSLDPNDCLPTPPQLP